MRGWKTPASVYYDKRYFGKRDDTKIQSVPGRLG